MKFVDHFYDALLSLYIYNEYTGYSQLSRLHSEICKRYPKEHEFITAIEKHRDDELKHYRMFKQYFLRCGRMPLQVDESDGYINCLVKKKFKIGLSQFNAAQLSEADLFTLFRLIILTEERGLKQVRQLLRNPLILKNRLIYQIFKTVETDEPDHFLPYSKFLEKMSGVSFRGDEKLIELKVHYSITLVRFPLLFFKPRKRVTVFYESPTPPKPPESQSYENENQLSDLN